MSEFKPSSKELLRDVLKPHTELALDLMRMVKSLSTGDPSYRFQIASVIIFLAGVDKTLSFAFELLYLADKVDWSWMIPNTKHKPPAGFIECDRGLTSKIMKLKDLGADITHLQWIIDLRNEYIHGCNIYMGYTLNLDETEGEPQLKPSGPTISFPLSPMTHIQPDRLQHFADYLIGEIGTFIDGVEWQSNWLALIQEIENLPQNPEPEYTQIINESDREFDILDTLNKRYIGDGAQLLKQ